MVLAVRVFAVMVFAVMVIESLRIEAKEKPWGRDDLSPWSSIDGRASAIGELWFERSKENQPQSKLLLKLLFSSQPLSIQVHPNDAFAHALGLGNGKTEAWYILAANPGAQVAVGLRRRLTSEQLRDAIGDGTIEELIHWLPVAKDDIIFIPGGTIHTLGAGLIVAELQQRCDTTFRLFDFGRGRELDVEHAVDASDARPADPQPAPIRIDDMRSLLITCEQFTLELIDLPPSSDWDLACRAETWIFTLQGHARFGEIETQTGQAVFAENQVVSIAVGADGFRGLVAYAQPQLLFDFLRNLKSRSASLGKDKTLSHFAVNDAAMLSNRLPLNAN